MKMPHFPTRLWLGLSCAMALHCLAGCDKLPFTDQAGPNEGPYGYVGGGVRMTVPEDWKIIDDKEVNGVRRILLNGPLKSQATIALVDPGAGDPGLAQFTNDFKSRLGGGVSTVTLLTTSDLRRIQNRQIIVQKLKREALGEEEIFLRFLERKRRGVKMGYTVFEFPLEAKEEVGTDIAFIKAKLEYDEVRFK
jgi:hypothetical protein